MSVTTPNLQDDIPAVSSLASPQPIGIVVVEENGDDDSENKPPDDKDAYDANDANLAAVKDLTGDTAGDKAGDKAAPKTSTAVSAQPQDINDALEYPDVGLTFNDPVEGASNARDLSVSDWAQVVDTNELLYGFYIREANQDIVRARKPAFVFKDPKSRPYFQIVDGSNIQVRETKNTFQRSLAQNAFSKHCIEANVSAGDLGLMAGISGKREREKTSDQASTKITRDQDYYAVFNFPRARLILDEEELELSEDCRAMLMSIRDNPTNESLQRFYKLFGHIFVTSVLLGGQQKTIKFAAALSTQSEDIQEDSLRNAVGAKINAQYVAMSVQRSKEKGKTLSQDDEQLSTFSGLGMTATGGNTLIGSDVHSWVQTVAPFKNWRVIENEISEPIYRLIGKFQGWQAFPVLCETIPKTISYTNKPWRRLISLWQKDKPLCWITQPGGKRSLQVDHSADALTRRAIFLVHSAIDPRDSSVEEFSRIYRGDITNEINKKLPWDYPILLETILSSNPEDLLNSSIPPLSVGVDQTDQRDEAPLAPLQGNMSIDQKWRFSLRRSGSKGEWNRYGVLPSEAGIASGDSVNLFCHSLGSGPFATFKNPPLCASPAGFEYPLHPPTSRLAAVERPATPRELSNLPPSMNSAVYQPPIRIVDLPVRDETVPMPLIFRTYNNALAVGEKLDINLVKAYDNYQLPLSQMRAFEKMGLVTLSDIEFQMFDKDSRNTLSGVKLDKYASKTSRIALARLLQDSTYSSMQINWRSPQEFLYRRSRPWQGADLTVRFE